MLKDYFKNASYFSWKNATHLTKRFMKCLVKMAGRSHLASLTQPQAAL
ncbi:MAG: hypothetical protein U0Y10_01565 [Spirosomataceae bacterium]